MKEFRTIMGMPVTVNIADKNVRAEDFEKVFSYFRHVDEKFSLYKETSEITRLNHGIIKEKDCSEEMKEVLSLCEETKRLTGGYFNIEAPGGFRDTSGLVKGWAIWNAGKILDTAGYENFFIDVGNDIEIRGLNDSGSRWRVGIRNPLAETKEIAKVVHLIDCGIATSGTNVRGLHIYNPQNRNASADEIASITVIGKNVYEADRFATAAFAMGKSGIDFINGLPEFEGYLIDKAGIATMTSGFEKYVK